MLQRLWKRDRGCITISSVNYIYINCKLVLKCRRRDRVTRYSHVGRPNSVNWNLWKRSRETVKHVRAVGVKTKSTFSPSRPRERVETTCETIYRKFPRPRNLFLLDVGSDNKVLSLAHVCSSKIRSITCAITRNHNLSTLLRLLVGKMRIKNICVHEALGSLPQHRRDN